MNWIANLCDLYDKHAHMAGVMMPDQPILLPLYHTTVTAQITVTINQEGEFLYAETVPEEDKLTIIPVTEKSASRAGTTIAPHPLCDNLKYIAGDYNILVEDKDYSQNYKMYIDQLEDWASSPYTHKKIQAIYQYQKKGTLMSDLSAYGVLKLNEAGRISEQQKIQGIDAKKSFVRFRVEADDLLPEELLEDEYGEYFAECWKDRTLQKNFIAYCESKLQKIDLSYLSGLRMPITYLQPQKIRHEGDQAKLISSNDDQNYTYRGRFRDKEEAYAIGYEDSQKMHNALKWIIRKQGSNLGGLCIVTWESDLHQLPEWKNSSEQICEQAKQDFKDIWDEEDENGDTTGEVDAARFRKSIQGYQRNLSHSSITMILAFDAATTGRLAMMECKEYQSSRYLEGLERWYRNCEWRHLKLSKERGRYHYTGMVGIRDAAELLYGTEQNGYFSMKGKEERYKEVAKRWLPCILDGKAIPEDMVQLAIHRASSPVSFKSRALWEQILGLACSMIKQHYKIKSKEDWTMALDETCERRDYLYGRLLALADRIEYRTYDKEDGRETNAKRYMCAFSQRPFRTWKVIEEKLEPYMLRLKPTERLFYQKIMNEIHSKFTVEDYENDTALNGLYLLGFHNQAYALQKKKENEEE